MPHLKVLWDLRGREIEREIERERERERRHAPGHLSHTWEEGQGGFTVWVISLTNNLSVSQVSAQENYHTELHFSVCHFLTFTDEIYAYLTLKVFKSQDGGWIKVCAPAGKLQKKFQEVAGKKKNSSHRTFLIKWSLIWTGCCFTWKCTHHSLRIIN